MKVNAVSLAFVVELAPGNKRNYIIWYHQKQQRRLATMPYFNFRSSVANHGVGKYLISGHNLQVGPVESH